MHPRPDTVLVLGYGNPGRRDDGLGPAAAAALEQLGLPGVTVEFDYQLTVEDAAAAARHDAVLFIDAACRGPAPYSFRALTPLAEVSFSTHSVAPEAVLGLAAELFQRPTPGWLLGIRGYEFNEFGEGLSARAQDNLAAALAFIEPLLRNRTLCDGCAPPAGAPAVAAVDEDQ